MNNFGKTIISNDCLDIIGEFNIFVYFMEVIIIASLFGFSKVFFQLDEFDRNQIFKNCINVEYSYAHFFDNWYWCLTIICCLYWVIRIWWYMFEDFKAEGVDPNNFCLSQDSWCTYSYGGVGSYLACENRDKSLVYLIWEGINQDFDNITKILKFKPNLWGPNHEDTLFKIKEDLHLIFCMIVIVLQMLNIRTLYNTHMQFVTLICVVTYHIILTCHKL